ncbi:hypothetical protein IAR55_005320 [Kwoniella newhampshirensis]|uniref:HECT-type E3 ubiquitin transferase n=1 Tax=Kwoniella newhampshirensis TaxID=1651941 RepID=A0AAW0YVA9_9TREE
MDDPPFDNTKYNDINLSTSASSSSAALLSSIRAERQAREQKRKEEYAALKIQKVWRGRKESERVKDGLLNHLESGIGVEEGGRVLLVLLKDSNGGLASQGVTKRVESAVAKWCDDGVKKHDTVIGLVEPLSKDQGWVIVLAILCGKILNIIARNPSSNNAPSLLAGLETIFDPKSYIFLSADQQCLVKATLVRSTEGQHWVEKLVMVLEKLVAASLPKKKHSLLLPVTRLLTAPFSLVPPDFQAPLIPPLINHLLAIPSLPSSLPLPALTHLSSHLNLFTLLLPFAVADPNVLSQGRMSTELGKTYFLANLATFGITGQMLARHGINGAAVWMGVVGTVLSGVNEGWGRWVDGLKGEDDDDEMRQTTRNGSENEGDEAIAEATATVPSRHSSRLRRIPLPQSIRSKLTIFATPAHISTLSGEIISPSSRASEQLLLDFAGFAVGLLSAFRGSPRWEGVLDSLGDGERGRALMKRLWREGIRGKWSNSSDRSAWDTFNDNPSRPCLLLLTYLYCHYLLLTPDDEFFSPSKNAFSTDEILRIAAIWRDLAFWGFMNGVSGARAGNTAWNDVQSSKNASMGNEEIRGLFTRGVTRVVERNARRQFADPDFWVMKSQIDMQGFVEAAVYEDAELAGGNNDQEDVDMAAQSAQLPRWARARQRFTKRQMAYISPRLGLLNNLPMAVPFQTRLEVFRSFIHTDKARLGIDYHGRRFRNSATIRRDRIAQDGFNELAELGPNLKGRVEITFVDQYGLTEAGIDGGGLFKEFLTSLSKEVFDTNRGLWLATDQNELYPNPHSYATEPHQLNWYRFIGQVLGKAIYEGILVDVSFAGFFLAKWLGRQSYLDDLNSLDKELYKGLTMLKNYPKPEELSLNFAITEDNFGIRESVDLIPGGSEIAVTAENRHEYIQLVCKYKLDKQIAAQSRAFFNGLSDLVDAKWLRMFDQQELQQLIGGEETPIDIDDLRAHCDVNGFPNDVTPRLFWKVVKGFSQEERRALLRFVTSCSRPPLLGFAHLNPKFGVKFNGADTERLPSASACFNLLKLPGYTTESALRTKLLQAITSGAGFDMS